MRTSESIDQIAAALVAVQAEIEDPVAKARNPQLGNSYAELSDVLQDVRPTLTKHGIAIIQSPGLDVGDEAGMVIDRATLTTRLLHTSGQWVEGMARSQMQTPTERQARSISPVQLCKATVTQMRRMGALAMVGVAERGDDTDGTTGGTTHDTGAVTRLGTAGNGARAQSPAQESATSEEATPAAEATPELKKLQGELMEEFARIGADPGDVQAACQQLAGVDSIYAMTAEHLGRALADIRERFPVEKSDS